MLINKQTGELNLKIVYCGPALSGKTTNLEQIYARVNPERRSDLISLKTHEDRTLYFDLIQLELGKIGGLTPKIHLYTVPGQTYYQASRRLVLQKVDGVVFVADSAPNRIRDNLTAWRDLKSHLASFDIALNNLPIVIQINKRDLPKTMSLLTIQKVLGINGYPVFQAVAVQGHGVLDTLKAIIQGVIKQVQP